MIPQDGYFTKTPNDLMSILMNKSTNASVKSILLVIARKTYGFQKVSDEISLSQFQNETELSRPTVVTALGKLKSVKLIIQLSKGRSKYSSSEWKIDLENWEEKLVKLNELVKNSNNQVASPLVKSTLQTKETKKIFNNYLKTSQTYKEKTLSKPQPQSKPQPEVVFRSHLKKIKEYYDGEFAKDPGLPQELELSQNTGAAVSGIIYYIQKYKYWLGIDHPFYKKDQLRDCFDWFLEGIKDIEKEHLAVDETVQKVIDRWFNTTPTDPNNLRLSHFVGNGSLIFWNSLQGVIIDSGANQKEEYADH